MARSLAALVLATLSLAACASDDALPAEAPTATSLEETTAAPAPTATPAPPSAADDDVVVTGEPDADELALPEAPAD